MKLNEFSVAWSIKTEGEKKEIHVFFVKGQFDFDNQTPTDVAVFGQIGIKGYKKEVKSDFNEEGFGAAELLRMYGEIYDFATKNTFDSPWSIIEPKTLLQDEFPPLESDGPAEEAGKQEEINENQTINQ